MIEMCWPNQIGAESSQPCGRNTSAVVSWGPAPETSTSGPHGISDPSNVITPSTSRAVPQGMAMIHPQRLVLRVRVEEDASV